MHNEENKRLEAMKRGFTLIEILIAVAIVGLMASVAVPSVMKSLNSSRERAAEEAVRNIKSSITTWMIDNKKAKPPTDLKVLVVAEGDEEPAMDGGEGALIDPWGTEFKVEVKGKRFAVVSAGPDGEFGNEDDIRSDKVKSAKKSN